jgi:hypothetical protein
MRRRDNCLFWAVRQLRHKGGYISMRRSRWGPFPHFLWSRSAPPDCQSFVPLEPRRRLFPPLLFRGRVKQGR